MFCSVKNYIVLLSEDDDCDYHYYKYDDDDHDDDDYDDDDVDGIDDDDVDDDRDDDDDTDDDFPIWHIYLYHHSIFVKYHYYHIISTDHYYYHIIFWISSHTKLAVSSADPDDIIMNEFMMDRKVMYTWIKVCVDQ